MKMKALLIVTMAVVGFAVLAPAAHADLIYSNLPSGINACCFTVQLHDFVGGVQVTVSLAGGATLFAATGNPTNHPGFAFNLDKTITSGAITSPQKLGTFHLGPDVTSGPSFGTFGYYFDNLGNGTSANNAGPLVFNITGVSASDFIANNSGYFFASDILTSSGRTKESAINTPGVPTPEPASLALLGSGLIGLALRRRKK